MRPKVVILVLVAAFALLGVVAVFKGVSGKSAGDSGGQASNAGNTETGASTETASTSATNTTVAQAPSGPVNATVDPELHAAIIAKEQERIDELVSEVDGTNNPVIISALIEKVENPEAEIRKAALAALVQINDTNAVPGLKQAADRVADPRAKVAVLDTIDYLNLPDAIPAEPPKGYTNYTGSIPKNLRMNSAFLHTNTSAFRASQASAQ
jgi:hypothetical protein